jgi:hypothetical protein
MTMDFPEAGLPSVTPESHAREVRLFCCVPSLDPLIEKGTGKVRRILKSGEKTVVFLLRVSLHGGNLIKESAFTWERCVLKSGAHFGEARLK